MRRVKIILILLIVLLLFTALRFRNLNSNTQTDFTNRATRMFEYILSLIRTKHVFIHTCTSNVNVYSY